jgi:small neutral amino acid transporter SnatA (MarC family)
MPLTAGPGAITVAITLSSSSESLTSTWYALIAVGVTVAALWASCTLLGGVMGRISDQTINILLRFAGLLLATIGVQLAFNGIKTFFGI